MCYIWAFEKERSKLEKASLLALAIKKALYFLVRRKTGA